MQKREIMISEIGRNHTRPVPELVDAACKFSSRIMIRHENMQANVKSMMGMAVFNIVPGMKVELTVEGGDEEQAIQAIEDFLTGK